MCRGKLQATTTVVVITISTAQTANHTLPCRTETIYRIKGKKFLSRAIPVSS